MEARKLGLASYRITDDCIGCGRCRKNCPWGAVIGDKKEKHLIEPLICQRCGTCWQLCSKRAVIDPAGEVRAGGGSGRAPRARIDGGACAGCRNCQLNCEQQAIDYRRGFPTGRCEVDEERCIGCGACLTYCASGCIEFGASDDDDG